MWRAVEQELPANVMSPAAFSMAACMSSQMKPIERRSGTRTAAPLGGGQRLRWWRVVWCEGGFGSRAVGGGGARWGGSNADEGVLLAAAAAPRLGAAKPPAPPPPPLLLTSTVESWASVRQKGLTALRPWPATAATGRQRCRGRHHWLMLLR